MDISVALNSATYAAGRIATQTTREYLLSLLRDGDAGAKELAETTDMALEAVRSSLNRAVAAGEAHIPTWIEGNARGRSYYAIYSYGKGENAPFPPEAITERTMEMLKAFDTPRTITEVAEIQCMHRNSVVHHVSTLHLAGLIHIPYWQDTTGTGSKHDYIPMYVAGPGEDAPKPPTILHSMLDDEPHLPSREAVYQSRMLIKLRSAARASGSALSPFASMAVQLGAA